MSKDDSTLAPDLVALVGSRICHDLVSPLGAIGNGLELMMLTGGEETPEMALVNESLVNARGRIRFFRIAFGAAEPGAVVRQSEIAEALAGSDRKATVDWAIPGDMPRQDAKLALLAVNCLDSAMPYGGMVRVAAAAGRLKIEGTADRFRIDEADWALLDSIPADVAPGKVQFALLSQEAALQSRSLDVAVADTTIALRI